MEQHERLRASYAQELQPATAEDSRDERADRSLYLCIVHVTKTFGDLVAVDDFSLDVKEGEFVCLLGPSGCGKTTLLRIIAGLEQPNRGQIIHAGKEITRLPPRQRDFGIVFQSYALFPNLTAAQNVAYGLENRKLPRGQVESRVGELLNLVGLPEVRSKYPAQLSGGMQQRIALARALATSPGLLLLDEPLSALDARVRVALRGEIKRLQRQVGVTTVHVTHDQEEALVMADRIVVMHHGQIEQVGTPERIYRSPATPFVADFVGAMNFLRGVVGPQAGQVQCGELLWQAETPDGVGPGSAVSVAVRPEDVRLTGVQAQLPNATAATVEEAEFRGASYRVHLRLEGLPAMLVAEVSANQMRDLGIRPGSSLHVQLPPHLVRVYLGHVGAGG